MSGTETFMRQVFASLARRERVWEVRPPRAGQPSAAAPHLLAEDRPDYERLVDEVLRAEAPGPDELIDAEQLRGMVLTATNAITATAAAEYDAYVRQRERLRTGTATGTGATTGSVGRAPAREAEPDGGGPGLVAVMLVLAPVLAGTTAAVFLLVGYGLRAASGNGGFARTLVSGGWTFAALTALSILLSMVWLLVTALRRPGAEVPAAPEAAAARDAWLAALRTRGIEPFVREVRRAVRRDPGHPGHPGHPD